MGQTLPNGIYLPAEGERNCYDGLEGNWRSLDSLISTVAGKASATHTHGNITNDGKVGTDANKPLITGTGGAVQAGSFGNQANTFCEGNDSRLSDARTPLAHTHTKTDVTDLLNSNFIPSANNSYDLGSSSYQWNNLYAKNYYYNGVAWGLDKENAWTNFNRFNGYRINIKNSSQEIGVIPTSSQWNGFSFVDKNNNQTVSFEHAFMGSGETRFKISIADNVASHDSGSTVLTEFLRMTTYSGGSGFSVGANLTPLSNNLNLGASTKKWKSFNGINPGALSLPDNSGYTNISGNITDLTGSINSYTPPFDGYVMVNVQPNSNNYAYVSLERVTVRSSSETTSGKNAMATIPVIGGKSIDISVIGASIAQARFTPCLGNV